MASLNVVHLIGNLGRDPEIRTFQNGGRVANFSIALQNRIKNSQTGEWEDGEPTWIDCKCFDREKGRSLATLAEKYLHKGDPVYIGGKLTQEKWQDKQSGQNRYAIRVLVDEMQFLKSKADGQQQNGQRQQEQRRDEPRPPDGQDNRTTHESPASYTPSDDIPF